jgi:WhiB family redox-sensing transcriptional regulator
MTGVYVRLAPDTLEPADTWRRRAACHGTGDAMFPEKSDTAGLRDARNLCGGCPVRTECLTHILTVEAGKGLLSRWGVYAGTTPRHRLSLHGRVVAGEPLAEVVADELYPTVPAGPTVREQYARRSAPADGGHRIWTVASTSVVVDGRRYTPNQLAFLAGRGREPVGVVRADCALGRGCVEPTHLTDDRDRRQRKASA